MISVHGSDHQHGHTHTRALRDGGIVGGSYKERRIVVDIKDCDVNKRSVRFSWIIYFSGLCVCVCV